MTDPHGTTEHLAQLDAGALASDLAAGRLTSEEAVHGLIDRVSAIDADGPRLAAVLALAADAVDVARARDEERREGRVRGPLHGVPVLIKDNIEAVGLPGTAGSLALADRPVASDAPLVAALRAAGAVILGSTNLSEWANFRSPHSVSGWSAVGGLTGNPWALDRSAGGSSSGSGAAVSAGLAPLAIGTETNGSITCPAALNGVVGLKPTVGTVSTVGVVPISASQDVPGPLARTVADAALVYEVLSGRRDCTPVLTDGTAAGVRVGVSQAWLSGDAATDALFADAVLALTPLVRSVADVALPHADSQVLVDQVAVLVGELRSDLDAYLRARPGVGVRSVADVVAFNTANAEAELGHFGQEYFEQAVAGDGRNGSDYVDARARNVAWAQGSLGPAYEQCDVLVSPAYRPAWKSDLVHGDVLVGGGAVCTPPAILGWPILTVPMGTVDGLPVGFSITGPGGSEPALIAVGRALEVALGLVGTEALRPAWRPPARG